MNYKNTLTIISITVSVLIVFLVSNSIYKYNTHATISPGESVILKSNRLDYDTNTPGSLKLEKSAKWTGYKKAQITIDLDTIPRYLDEEPNLDVLMILDVSGSMAGNKLTKVKEDSIELIDEVLDNQDNKVGLITFETNSTIISNLTNDKNELINTINSLNDLGATNYYDALKNAENLLEGYQKEENRELILLFLTDGYPNEKTPNEVEEYKILKEKHPYMIIQGIQYEMGEDILEPIKRISDNQFIADMYSLNNVLFETIYLPISYDSLVITDYINDDFFEIVDYEVYSCDVSIDGNKITWNLDNTRSGNWSEIFITIRLKDNIEEQDIYATNKKTELFYSIDGIEEQIETEESPLLKGKYTVSYDGNLPDGCLVNNIPESNDYYPYSVVEKSNEVLVCEGYEFRGWKIPYYSAEIINEDYFRVLYEDVTLIAEWSKPELSKSLNGTPREQLQGTLMKANLGDYIFNKWLPKNKIETVKTLDNRVVPNNAIDSWDASKEQNGSVIAWYTDVDNNNLYELFIGQDEGVIANQDCSNLFNGFYNATSIDLSNLNTSNATNMNKMFNGCSALQSIIFNSTNAENVTSMQEMFRNCLNLISLDLSSFDTKNVTTFNNMFYYCNKLTTLDLSNFDSSNAIDISNMFMNCQKLENIILGEDFTTANVTNMSSVFGSCNNLVSLNLSRFNTSNVTNMTAMFTGCNSLTSINFGNNFDTSNVENMKKMFSGCNSLESLNLSFFNTPNVTDMSYMFNNCEGLTSLIINSFITSNVLDMSSMFSGCTSLNNLSLNNFNTSKVNNMASMFYNCKSLTDLDLNNFITLSVTDMSYMFKGCLNLSNLNIDSFNTSNVTSMYYMFASCRALITLSISNFNTSQVTNTQSMFEDCSSLISLDLSSIDTSSITEMKLMFYGCSSLVTVYVSDLWDVSNLRSTLSKNNNIFDYCNNLVGGNGTSYSNTLASNTTYARIDTEENPGYFTRKGAVE